MQIDKLMIMETVNADMWYGGMEGRRLQSRGQPWQGVLTVSAILSCQPGVSLEPSVSRCGEVTPPPPAPLLLCRDDRAESIQTMLLPRHK